MNANSYHDFALDTRDREGRRWCRVCALPENNARARRLHNKPLPRLADWRAKAWGDTEDRRAA